jgi:cell division protein FtsZ
MPKEPIRAVEPSLPREEPAATVTPVSEKPAADAQERRDPRPLAQEPPEKTAARATEQDEDDLLEIPAFLRRQAN